MQRSLYLSKKNLFLDIKCDINRLIVNCEPYSTATIKFINTYHNCSFRGPTSCAEDIITQRGSRVRPQSGKSGSLPPIWGTWLSREVI